MRYHGTIFDNCLLILPLRCIREGVIGKMEEKTRSQVDFPSMMILSQPFMSRERHGSLKMDAMLFPVINGSGRSTKNGGTYD